MTVSKSSGDGWLAGCFVIVICLVGLIGWAGYWLAHQIAPCNGSFVSKYCARNTLEKDCKSRDIESVVSVEYPPDDPKGNTPEVQSATVVYEFKFIPEAGKTSTAATMRGSSYFVYDTKQFEWVTFCQ